MSLCQQELNKKNKTDKNQLKKSYVPHDEVIYSDLAKAISVPDLVEGLWNRN
jgi:hypothetical protein